MSVTHEVSSGARVLYASQFIGHILGRKLACQGVRGRLKSGKDGTKVGSRRPLRETDGRFEVKSTRQAVTLRSVDPRDPLLYVPRGSQILVYDALCRTKPERLKKSSDVVTEKRNQESYSKRERALKIAKITVAYADGSRQSFLIQRDSRIIRASEDGIANAMRGYRANGRLSRGDSTP